MPTPRDVHRAATRVMSTVIVLIGVALLVSALTLGAGPLGRGVVLGVLFVLAGAARLYLARGER